ncbi:MAG TPA: STAS domain-containing protein, partial [Candidatus Tumulicola sp.]|nr:STAS domain-containing protein [Candidatus Tumulicola sp.]
AAIAFELVARGVVSAAGVSVVRLAGELEIGRKAEIRDALQLRGSERSVLIDFSQVTYADSTALAELLRFRADAQRREIPIAVLVGSPQLDRIVQYAGLSQAIPIFHERSEALAHLCQGRGS